jgi:hypothetical protein
VRAAFPDFWRAPVDNDLVMAFGDPVAVAWYQAGLDRLEHETVAVRAGDDWLSTELRIAPAGQDFARELCLFDSAGAALSVSGQPPFDFAVRHWSPELLAAARHTPDLVPDGRTYLHLDIAHHGIGSGSCGPGPLPGDSLMAHPVGYALRFSS